MGRYVRSRQPNGRFRRATLANTFGLEAPVCPNEACRRFNPHRVGEPDPTHCHACGTALQTGGQTPASNENGA